MLLKRAASGSRLGLLWSVLLLLLVRDVPGSGDIDARLARLVAGKQFEFVGWTIQAVGMGVAQGVAADQNYLQVDARKKIVVNYFDLLGKALSAQRHFDETYVDPSVADPKLATAAVVTEPPVIPVQIAALQPLAQAILQEQISLILSKEGFGLWGKTVPPVSFRITDLPNQIVVSPRTRVALVASAHLAPGLDVQEHVQTEAQVDTRLDVSSLVVPLGGLSTFPTMIHETPDLNYVIQISVHEWVHLFLALRPLGLRYDASPDLRTMNETTANLVGQEIGAQVIERYYPERVKLPVPEITESESDAQHVYTFDFRREMRETRVRLDELLDEGHIEEAEAYLATRREFFAAHSYHLRKLNQAYFAFYGAYADGPGATGEDPVGPAVVKLWERSNSIREFLDTMAGMTSFEGLQAVLRDRER